MKLRPTAVTCWYAFGKLEPTIHTPPQFLAPFAKRIRLLAQRR